MKKTIENRSLISEHSRILAEIIVNAVQLREDSYDKDSADVASEKCERERLQQEKDNPGSIFYGYVDYSKFYTMSLEDCCEKVAKDKGSIALGTIAYLALNGWWNDTIDWAQKVLDPTATCEPSLYVCQHGVNFKHTDEDIDDRQEEPLIDDKYEETTICPKCDKLYEENRRNR